MKLVLMSFTPIYSATCALVLSFHINVCAGYMCSSYSLVLVTVFTRLNAGY